MCEENCGNCCTCGSDHEGKDEKYFIQFAEQEDFILESAEENADGSMNVIFTVSEMMKNLLIEKGLNAIIKEFIENEEKERGL
jgi:hypothetical protein